ncbi:hypothetical protein [Paenibacillus methanolicus]|uniref:Uncharacterized protein n=1 Tax=Paenibacillus methanolicus TaxID=582686 RepID=A0A5S5CJG7_9BACL|nr:hypothetical protein [Paenibacillus methanolicus]TYP79880.1 hypothetical protein BCM02_1011001 [Paenibacillus methanolicus]
MASSTKVFVPQGVVTLVYTGTGEKVLLQTGQIYIGGSNVSASNGLFLTGYYCDFYDLGVVALNEEIYALSTSFDNEVTIFTYS